MEIKCSICGTAYKFVFKKDDPLPENFPFCSKRCKSIDLGKWLNEEYRISTPLTEVETLTEIERQILNELQEETLARLLGDDVESE